MTINFSEYFWGEGPKTSGIDVLFQNIKYGITTTKEVSDFLRERSSIEESHSRALGKLAKVATNGCPHGSFAPLWQFIKTSSEKLSTSHIQMAQKVEVLMKELTKYSEELQKKHKAVKDEEASTIEAVQLYQNSKSMVSKTKAIYVQRNLELEKCQKESASPKETEKAEVKMRKAQEEYKSWVEKYQIFREDYLTKFSKACQRFQDLEVIYLTQMKEFLDNYATLMATNHEMIGQVHLEFRDVCSKMTVEELLMKFVNNKCTGKDKPGMLEVEDIGAADAISRGSGSSEDKSMDKVPSAGEKKREGEKGNSPDLGTESWNVQPKFNALSKSTVLKSSKGGPKWFLRNRKGKKNEKKSKTKDADQDGKDDKSDVDDRDESQKANSRAAEIDEEGYTVRPSCAWESDKNNFYSSSDSDSEEEPEKRLHVEIKPLSNGTAPLSASVDELRSTVENLTLSPVGAIGRKLHSDVDNQMKRSQSVSQQIGNSSPPSLYPYSPLSPPIQPTNAMSTAVQNNSASRYADLGDIFAEVGEIQSSFPTKSPGSRGTPTPGGVSIPRPSSRPRHEIMLQRNTSSPSPVVSRTESVSSIDSKGGSYLLGSRGPSPLTLGMTDPIPIAVAFHEIVHAYFKANDETQCKVKMTGDLMVSFPAGIIQIFSRNPSPAQLKFKVRSTQPLENLISNKNLAQLDHLGDELVFEFDMSALTILLKTHAEQNPNASYFNIDILKYQIKPKPGATSCPLHLVAFWKCETNQTDLRIDYKYNSHATEPTKLPETPSISPKVETMSGAELIQVCIAAPVDGDVKTMQSRPTGQWFPNTNRSCWKLPSLSSKSDNLGVGSLRARFEVANGPSSRGTIAAQFSCESSTLSGSDFELMGSGYRVSLVKKRFVSGKYVCGDSEGSSDSSRFAALP